MVPPIPILAADPLPTSMVGQGTYYVYATREGLVGGTTSSGHRIVENDFFVSLPACTPQNCPRGATWGNMTQCGSRCYVRVLNPVTNQCRVEPIKDIGPWFTVDDWWNPTETRYLNTLPTNPNILPQGYTASDAARDGLDVGYGRAGSGIGRDNTHQLANRGPRAVGNRAAIDLADGTWRNLRLTSPDTIGSRVFVTLLWQSGGDPASEAAACGHPLNQRGGTGSTLPAQPQNPYPYPPPVATVPVTPVTDSFAIVIATGGAGLRCRTAPSTAGGHITTMPEGTRIPVRGVALGGWQPVTCNGQDGWASTSYLRVTYATATPTPPSTETPPASPTADIGTPTMEAGTPTMASGTPTSDTGTPTEQPATPTETPGTPTPPTDATPSGTPTNVPASPTPTVPPPPGRAVVAGTGGAGLRCRNAPSTAGARITGLAEGSTIAIRGAAIGGWMPVTCAGQDGWVSASYLRLIAAPAPATPTSTPSPATGTPTTTPSSTPVVTPSVTPTNPSGPQLGEAIVTGTGGLGLRCRNAPSTAGGHITTMAEGARIQVSGPATGTWLPVKCGGRDGWASTTYLRVTRSTDQTPTPNPTSTPATTANGTVANSGGANVRCRALPSLQGTILASLAPGTTVEILGPANGDWLPVRCAGRDGYMWAEYVSVSAVQVSRQMTQLQSELLQADDETDANLVEPAPSPSVTEVQVATAPEPTEAPATNAPEPTSLPVTGSGYIASDDGGAINCRAEPSTGAAVITVLQHGEWIETRGVQADGWQGVRCAGLDGFVAAQFLSDSPPPAPTEPALEPEPESSQSSSPSEPPPVSAPAGSHPQFGGSVLYPDSAWDSNGNASVWNVLDGDAGSAWSSVPGAGQASITVDLGQSYQLTGIRWMFSQSGGASDVALLVSQDGESWSHVASSSNRAPGSWEGAWTESTARYVRIAFTSSAGESVLGYLAELQVWGVAAGSAIESPVEPGIANLNRPVVGGRRARFGGKLVVA